MESQKDRKFPVFYIVPAVVFLVAVTAVLVVSLIYGLTFSELSNDQEKFGQFGDFFGGILNPVFSFLTITLLVCSIILQRMELSKVVEELDLTRRVHLSSVNMNHWEHIINGFVDGDSEILHSSLAFKELLDSEIQLVVDSKKEKSKSFKYSVYEIFSNPDLFN